LVVDDGDVVVFFADVDTDVQVTHVDPPGVAGCGSRGGPVGGVPVRSFDKAINGSATV
jgi:hypothetical protein